MQIMYLIFVLHTTKYIHIFFLGDNPAQLGIVESKFNGVKCELLTAFQNLTKLNVSG
jgi:hypothetical protein